MLWMLPAATVVVVIVPVLLAMRGVAREAAALRRSLGGLHALREPVRELRDEVVALTSGVPELRLRTRPALPPSVD